MTRASKRERALRAPRSRGGASVYVLLVIFLVLLSVLVYFGVRWYNALARGWQSAQNIFQTQPPITGTPPPTLRPLDPINILLLGVDRREGELSTRSDVNIVVHIDPARRFASMLSIPRDTGVYIPGHGYDKINAAYSVGERQMPGSGPLLAKETVSQFLDMPIHYYVEVDFYGFERIVDWAGGIDIDVPAPLIDNEYPTPDYGYTRIYIPAGLQHMDGATALMYARSRHADSDLGRNRRQQQVLLALRSRILSSISLTNPEQISDLARQLGDALKTDMPPEPLDLFNLYMVVSRIEPENIASYALDWHVLTEYTWTTTLEPCLPCVREIARQMQMDPTTRRLQEEGARVEVRNGTWENGLAGRTAEYLRNKGFTVVGVLQDENAGTYSTTLILDDGNHPFTRDLLTSLLRVQPANVRLEPNVSAMADIVIILGNDFQVPKE